LGRLDLWSDIALVWCGHGRCAPLPLTTGSRAGLGRKRTPLD